MKRYIIYCDGACKGNPGPGAYGYVVLDEKAEKLTEGSLYFSRTTNNQMEMEAVIAALNWVKTNGFRGDVEVFTDSTYLVRGMTEWLPNWIRRNWRNHKGEPVKNRELWTQLRDLEQGLTLHWRWVKGHSGDRWNDYVDQLCNSHF